MASNQATLGYAYSLKKAPCRDPLCPSQPTWHIKNWASLKSENRNSELCVMDSKRTIVH